MFDIKTSQSIIEDKIEREEHLWCVEFRRTFSASEFHRIPGLKTPWARGPRGTRNINRHFVFCHGNRAERRVMYYRCLAHIPRTLATVADSYRPVYVSPSSALYLLLKRWNPGRRDSGRSAENVFIRWWCRQRTYFSLITTRNNSK